MLLFAIFSRPINNDEFMAVNELKVLNIITAKEIKGVKYANFINSK